MRCTHIFRTNRGYTAAADQAGRLRETPVSTDAGTGARSADHGHACCENPEFAPLDLTTRAGGTLQSVEFRPRIDLDLATEGAPVESETTCTWAGAHVLTIHTVVPRPDLALELHSTFVGHPGLRTHVVHLLLGPPGYEPALTSSDVADTQLEPTYAPRACAYEHAQRLIEVLNELGYPASVSVPGESAFGALERNSSRMG
jgi:hypothetical protein